MEIYVKISFISVFALCFWFSNRISSDAFWFYPYCGFKHSKWFKDITN